MLPRLISAFHGEIELTTQQVQIGLALIKKVLPDTSHQIVEASLEGKSDRKKSTSELYQEVIDGLSGKEG